MLLSNAMNNLVNQKSKYMVIEGIVSVIINVLLFVLKYIVGVMSSSLSLIADAWHSLSDSISSIIIIFGGIYAKRPADKDHPFGHGRMELIASLVIGIMLIFIGYNFFYDAILNIRSKKMATFSNLSIIVMLVSIIIKELLAQYSFFLYRKFKLTSLYADAWHHRSDSITSIIILVGIFFAKSVWWIDSLLSIIVSIVILVSAYDVIRSSIKPLIGEYPSEELISQIKSIADRLNLDSDSLHHFHIHNYGCHCEITFHIRFDKNTTVYEAHKEVSIFEDILREELRLEATIHIESY